METLVPLNKNVFLNTGKGLKVEKDLSNDIIFAMKTFVLITLSELSVTLLCQGILKGEVSLYC
jgi:hypothetical protein